MFSSIGRAALKRTGVNRVAPRAWSSGVVPAQGQFALYLQRLFATTSTTTQKPAKTVTKVKVTTTASKGRKPAAKKPAAKKAAKEPPKKAIKKKSVKKAKKKVVVKPKPKPRKILSPEVLEKKKITELKKLTLLNASPKFKPAAPYAAFVKHWFANHDTTGTNASAQMTKIAESYKALSDSEKEDFVLLAKKNKADNDIAKKAWIETYTPDQIRIANNARNTLLRKGLKTPGLHSPLHDDRLPKRGLTPYTLFLQSRWASGDYKGVPAKDSGARIASEFKALPPAELEALRKRAESDRLRYEQEFKTVFHRDSTSKSYTAV